MILDDESWEVARVNELDDYDDPSVCKSCFHRGAIEHQCETCAFVFELDTAEIWRAAYEVEHGPALAHSGTIRATNG